MLDTHLTFTQHCNNIAVKVQQRNNVWKALSGSTWGWATQYSATAALSGHHHHTNWSRLQRPALRIATGCPKMADVAELHQEVRELPVHQHNELISQQFALTCHIPQHPSHQLCHRPPDDQLDRQRSLIGSLKPNIQQFLTEKPLINTSYKSAISSIHQDVVRTAIESSSSKLLNGRPLFIATAKQTLPRKTRTILAQLCTGHSRILGQYMNRIDRTARNHCHDCVQSPHDTHNLLDCSLKNDHTDSRIAMVCADRNRKTPQLVD